MNKYPKLNKREFGRIAKITGMSASTVESHVYGYRDNAKIDKAIKAYLEAQEELDEELRGKLNPTY
jgi:hypothetical protein